MCISVLQGVGRGGEERPFKVVLGKPQQNRARLAGLSRTAGLTFRHFLHTMLPANWSWKLVLTISNELI